MEFHHELLNHIGSLLWTKNETVSVAESVTSGFLQFSFSQMKNASLFYKGGMTTYTLEEKVKLLKINREEAKACDSVSQNITETMALNNAEIFETDWSIAVTGYSTPVRNSAFALYSYFSIAYHHDIIFSDKIELHSKTKPIDAQLYYAEYILNSFKSQLEAQI